VGRLLRRWADRLDPDNALRRSGYSYTVERRSTHNPNSVKLHIDGTGSAFWVSAADQEKRFTDAATDWRSPNEKLAHMLDQFRQAVAEEAGKPARAYGGPVMPPQPTPYDPATDGPIIRLREDT